MAAVVLLLGFATTMGVQAQRIAKERDRANREAEASRRVAEFMTNMFKVSDPNEARGNRITAREILDKASHQIHTGLSQDPELQAEMMDVMGNVYWNLGLYSRAHPLLEQSADTRLRLLGPEHPATLLSWYHMAAALDREGHFAEAEKLERKTLDIRRRVLGPEHPDTLRALNILASTIERKARDLPDGPEKEASFAEAEKLEREALAVRRRILGTEHADTLASMLDLGSTLDSAGRYAEAEKLQRETIEIQRRVLGPYNPATLGSMNNLAFSLEHLHRDQEAEKIYREALDIQRRVLGPEHPDTLLTMDNLNNTIAEQGRYAEAEKLCRETLDIRRRALGPEHPDTATSKYELAGLLARQGKRTEALSVLRDAIDHGLAPGTDVDIEKDEDFQSLHADPRFVKLVAHAKERAAGQKP
jgi:non-specific serine/threonine protein kinase/serine/threonine-protein kinase